jgi:hypothetical protein
VPPPPPPVGGVNKTDIAEEYLETRARAYRVSRFMVPAVVLARPCGDNAWMGVYSHTYTHAYIYIYTGPKHVDPVFELSSRGVR